MNEHSELLNGLSIEELDALADGLLAPSAQERLSELLARKKETSLLSGEQQELDRLLQSSDQLTLIKTRARYTLNRMKLELAGR